MNLKTTFRYQKVIVLTSEYLNIKTEILKIFTKMVIHNDNETYSY